MRINSIQIRDFRRFRDLAIQGVPPSTKLVVMAGPNGAGKSSVFDAMMSYQRSHSGFGLLNDSLYFLRGLAAQTHFSPPNNIMISFHEGHPKSQEVWKRSFYARSAYRNDPDFTLSVISKQGRVLDQVRLNRMADNDATVSQNYSALTSQALHDLFTLPKTSPLTAVSFRDNFIGDINENLAKVFDDLTLTSLGVPGEAGAFFFTKGQMVDFHYKNLSGGEKAAFDLIIDLIVKRPTFNNTVYCIDEPEAHLNTRTQGRLMRALYELIPDNCQLWVATHAIGMIREARDLYYREPGAVCFLDFAGRDFDQSQIIEPVAPIPAFWRGALGVALDDLSSLVAPEHIVICEGTPAGPGKAGGNFDNDAKCYNVIFAKRQPDTLFVSGGNSHDVSTDRHVLVSGFRTVIEGATVTRVIDRDDNSDEEVRQHTYNGIRVLRRRHLESYLWSDEILTLLCEQEQKPECIGPLLEARQGALNNLARQGKASDDIKSAAGAIYNSVKSILGLFQAGSNAREFMRVRLAPLAGPDTAIYAELNEDIFGH